MRPFAPLIALLALASPAVAQAPAVPTLPTLPWGDTAPTVVEGEVRVAALGTPDPRVGRWSAERLSARRRGEARAKERLHRWVDAQLGRVAASPRAATVAHRAVDRHAEVRAVRPLVDASAVVLVGLPAERLPDVEGVPW